MALDEELPERPEDKTIPKYRQITKVSLWACALTFFHLRLTTTQRAGELIEEWTLELDKQLRIRKEANSDETGIATKRSASVNSCLRWYLSSGRLHMLTIGHSTGNSDRVSTKETENGGDHDVAEATQ